MAEIFKFSPKIMSPCHIQNTSVICLTGSRFNMPKIVISGLEMAKVLINFMSLNRIFTDLEGKIVSYFLDTNFAFTAIVG